MLNCIVSVVFVIWKIGRAGLADGLRVQIIPDHLRYKIIDALVVGHTVARRVQEPDIAGPQGGHDVRNADKSLGPEAQRV